MAEELLRKECGTFFDVESAGISPGVLNPLAIEVLLEVEIDIRGKKTKDVNELVKSGKRYSQVITVCDEFSAEQCPVFPGVKSRLHWSFPDPSKFEGTWEERLEQTRRVRHSIQQRIHQWCATNCDIKAV